MTSEGQVRVGYRRQRLRHSIVSLQVHLFGNTFLALDVMAAAYAFLESRISHQRSQVGEADVRVRSPAEDDLRQSLMPGHGPPSVS